MNAIKTQPRIVRHLRPQNNQVLLAAGAKNGYGHGMLLVLPLFHGAHQVNGPDYGTQASQNPKIEILVPKRIQIPEDRMTKTEDLESHLFFQAVT